MNKAKKIVDLVALGLAVVFLVFNVGLPIVLASCPMAKEFRTPLCGRCAPVTGGGAALSLQTDRSCCATVIAADRNTTEFREVKRDLGHHSVLTLGHFYQVTFSPSSVVTVPGVSAFSLPPPRSEDIPILISSLLI